MTREEFEQALADYNMGAVYDTLDEANFAAEQAYWDQAYWEAEQANERYFENRGTEEAELQVRMEQAAGVVDHQAYPETGGRPTL